MVQDRIELRSSRQTEFLDLTGQLQRAVEKAGLLNGRVHLQTLHTTLGLAVNENEPLLLADFQRLLERLAPLGGYDHDDMSRRQGVAPDEPTNGHAHCQQLLLSTSETLPVTGGRLVLGPWQRVFLVELCSGRQRRVTVQVMGR